MSEPMRSNGRGAAKSVGRAAFFGSLLCSAFLIAGADGVRAEGGTQSQAAPPRPVNVEQYNQLVRYVKSLNERIRKLEAQKSSGGDEETVDLGAMAAESTAPAKPSKSGSPHARPGADPMFKTLFDLNLVSRPGLSPLSFENFHSLLMFEIAPTPELQFSFDVNPTPRYYEVDYQVGRRVQLRAGRIWIPFDDLSPHNIFGGRVNVSRLSPGSAFLPDLWTDLGVGVKVDWVDSPSFSLLSHLYVVNGFRDGASDSFDSGGLGINGFPSFADVQSTTDNNDDKAVGGRVAMKFGGGVVSMGLSGYYGRWSDQGVVSKSLLILGGDAQLRLSLTELRAGIATMRIGTLSDAYDGVSNRAGGYVEVGQKFGRQSPFKVLFRGGALQMDDRLIDADDQTWVGSTFVWQPGPFQLSLEHSRDIQLSIPGKTNTNYTIARFVLAL